MLGDGVSMQGSNVDAERRCGHKYPGCGQELRGHKEVSKTMIHTYVLNEADHGESLATVSSD
jgi:hypothetical protein